MRLPLEGSSRTDPLLPLVREAVDLLLQRGDVVTPLEVLLHLELVEPDAVELWRKGGLPYLERGIVKGLAKTGRVLQTLRTLALELGLRPVPGKYVLRGKGKRRLRFSKDHEAASEQAYSCHYVRPAKPATEA